MESEAGEFQDWELLHHNNLEFDSDLFLVNSAELKENNKTDDIEDDSEGMFQTNYFSLESQKRYPITHPGPDVSEVGSENSDNPSWIDPGLETRYPRKSSAEFWSDSGSERSDDRKLIEFEGKNEVGFVQNEKQQVGFEGIEEIETGNEENSVKCWSDSGGIGSGELKAGGFDGNSEMKVGGFDGNSEMKVGGFDGNSDMGVKENENLRGGSESLGEEKRENESFGDNNESQSVGNEARKVEEVKNMSVVWWKVPMEFLRYCVFRVNPGWTLSVAAAFMGFVILGRRLYKMKKKSKALELKVKVTMDDKKISQFMSRAARLNEAFSVVKRVPVIRPSLPAVGVTPWPVVSMR